MPTPNLSPFAESASVARRNGYDDKTIADHLSIEPALGDHIDRRRAAGLLDSEIVDEISRARSVTSTQMSEPQGRNSFERFFDGVYDRMDNGPLGDAMAVIGMLATPPAKREFARRQNAFDRSRRENVAMKDPFWNADGGALGQFSAEAATTAGGVLGRLVGQGYLGSPLSAAIDEAKDQLHDFRRIYTEEPGGGPPVRQQRRPGLAERFGLRGRY